MLLAIPAAALLLVGVTPAPKISPLLSDVAGKSATASCQTIKRVDGSDSAGYVPTVGGNVAYLAPWVCVALNRRIAHKSVDSAALADAVFVMVHEGNHLRGTADESQADCDALHQMPALLRKWWKFTHAQIHEAMMYAWDAHSRGGPEYTRLC